MISDAQQDQATLYALDASSAEERSAFERELAGNPELQELVRELREAAGTVALSASQFVPAADVKRRVLEQIRSEAGRVVPMPRSSFRSWMPWAIAAGLAVTTGVLLNERAKLQRELVAQSVERTSLVLVPLKPSDEGPSGAQATVAWNDATQTGTIQIANLPRAASGKDYQLWLVDAAHADPISAGIVRVDPNGATQAPFKPDASAHQVKAIALSIEREGGVPKREGPILLIGTT